MVGSQQVSCIPEIQTFSVETTEDALHLVERLNCTRGNFLVEWIGRVVMVETLRVFEGTTLFVHGGDPSSVVMDGAGSTQLFQVQNATLEVSGLGLTRGDAANGGAIEASGSRLAIANCTFSGNNANINGGAIALDGGTNLEVGGQSTFTNNSATSAGAIYLSSSVASIQGDVMFVSNNASVYGGAILAFDGSTMSLAGETKFIHNAAGQHGGAVDLFVDSTLLLSGDIIFHGNKASGDGGGISMNEGSVIRQEGVATFTNNEALIYGGAIEVSSDCSVFLGGEVRFEGNTGQYGGATSFYKDSYLGSSGSVWFVNNSAIAGGAFEVEDNCNISFAGDTLFAGNIAESGGGGFYSLGNVYMKVEGANFDANIVRKGSGGGVFLGSSGKVSQAVEFIDCNFSRNKAFGGSGGAFLVSSGYVDILGNNFVENMAGATGGAIFSGALRARIIDCDLVRNTGAEAPAVYNNLFLEAINTSFSGNERFCDNPLEYIDRISGNRSEDSCSGCSIVTNGIFEDPLAVEICTGAPSYTTSPGARDTVASLVLDSGYWRSSNTSVNISECYNDNACLGGVSDYCAPGYTGPYCAVCAEHYTQTLKYTCETCSGTAATATLSVVILVTAASTVALSLGAWFLIFGAKTNAAGDQHFRRKFPLSWFWRVFPRQSLKIVIVSLQITTEFASIASATYPNIYERFVMSMEVFSFDVGWLISTGCYMETNFYHRLVAVTAVPFVITGLLAVTYTVASRRHRGDEEMLTAVTRRHTSAFILMAFFLYATISSTVFETFVCDELDDGRMFLRVDHRLECNSETHLRFMLFARLMVYIYPVGIPLLFALVLWNKRSTLTADDRDENISIKPIRELWKPYRKDVYYYEVVECLRRVTLSGVVVFFSPSSTGQIVVTFLAALSFYIISEGLHPYDRWQEAWVSRIGHLLTLLGVYLALLPRIKEEDSGEEMLGRALVAGNCIMICSVAVQSVLAFTSETGLSQDVLPRPRWSRGEPPIFVEEVPPSEDEIDTHNSSQNASIRQDHRCNRMTL